MTAQRKGGHCEKAFTCPGRGAGTFVHNSSGGSRQPGQFYSSAVDVYKRQGQVFTADQFYNDNPEAGEMYRKFGILALEMETAGLYWTAQRLGKRALAILTISDHIFTGEALNAQERQDSFHEMMEIALETAWKSLGE